MKFFIWRLQIAISSRENTPLITSVQSVVVSLFVKVFGSSRMPCYTWGGVRVHVRARARACLFMCWKKGER